jgi:hypothetical protein
MRTSTPPARSPGAQSASVCFLDYIIVGRTRQNVFGFAKAGVVEDTQVGGTPRSTDSSVDANQGYS